MQTNAFELRFQDDLNLVMYKSDKAYWASGSGRIDNIGKECVLAMELNGNLKIGTYWETGTDGNPGAFLAVEDYGVATVYAVDGKKVLWASSVLPPGSTIPADDKSLFSSCKNYELVFQHDKNLVLYQRHYTSGALSHRTALWCTRTNSKVETLKMEESGNLVLYDSSNVEVWSIKTNQSDSYLKVETGYISIYSATHERLWTSLGESWMSRMPADTKVRKHIRLLIVCKLILIFCSLLDRGPVRPWHSRHLCIDGRFPRHPSHYQRHSQVPEF